MSPISEHNKSHSLELKKKDFTSDNVIRKSLNFQTY
jgi:hypothetical protein